LAAGFEEAAVPHELAELGLGDLASLGHVVERTIAPTEDLLPPSTSGTRWVRHQSHNSSSAT
jgi:hypothetical protein